MEVVKRLWLWFPLLLPAFWILFLLFSTRELLSALSCLYYHCFLCDEILHFSHDTVSSSNCRSDCLSFCATVCVRRSVCLRWAILFVDNPLHSFVCVLKPRLPPRRQISAWYPNFGSNLQQRCPVATRRNCNNHSLGHRIKAGWFHSLRRNWNLYNPSIRDQNKQIFKILHTNNFGWIH